MRNYSHRGRRMLTLDYRSNELDTQFNKEAETDRWPILVFVIAAKITY